MNPRTRRLQSDFDSVRSIFSGHKSIHVNPLGPERPPESYRVTYNLRGLRLEGDRPVVAELHEIEIMLPRRYPAEKPYIVPKSSIFHPNIKEYVCIADHWAAESSLVDVVIKIGEMIQWKIYNPKSYLDRDSAEWAMENEDSGLFPVGHVKLGVEEVEIQVSIQSPDEAPAKAPGSRRDSGDDDGSDFLFEIKD